MHLPAQGMQVTLYSTDWSQTKISYVILSSYFTACLSMNLKHSGKRFSFMVLCNRILLSPQRGSEPDITSSTGSVEVHF
jgi:hypothetical protein